MSWLDGFRHRVRVLFNPSAFERDLRAEIQHHHHLDSVQGYDNTTSRQRFGNETWYREEARRQTLVGFLDVLRQDATYAWRSMRRTPGVTVMIVLTLALGLGVNAAAFSVLDRLFLRPPSGVANAGDVRRAWFEYSAERMADGKATIVPSTTYPRYRALVETAGTPDDFALYATDFSLYMGHGRERTRVRAVFASASYFGVLGMRPALGRVYTRHEDSLGNGAHVAVVSDRFWHTALGADSGAVGRRVSVDGEAYTIIGILPAGFTGLDLQAVDMWIPLASIPRSHWIISGSRPGLWWEGDVASGFSTIFRAGAVPPTFEQAATAAVRIRNREVDARLGDTLMNVHTSGLVGPGLSKPGAVNVISTRLTAVAAIVLIIACANVINLLLARAVNRRREIAVRLALGISRGRLIRLLTTETLLLALLGGGVAVLFAWTGGTVLRTLMMPEVVWYDSPLHWRVVAFALALSAVAGIVAGVLPALQASNPQLTNSLKDGARDSRSHKSRLRSALLATQASLSFVLLIGAMLFMRSLENVRRIRIGYDADEVVLGGVHFHAEFRPPTAIVVAELDRIADVMASRAGVEGVARSAYSPMQGISALRFFWDSDSSRSLRPNVPTFVSVSSTFFQTVGMRIIRGSTFASKTGAPKEVVINEAMAARMWPGTDPIGRCIRFRTRDAECYTVAAVVENGRQSSVIEDTKPLYYLPLNNLPGEPGFGWTIIVRASDGLSSAVVAALTTELGRAFPSGEVKVNTLRTELEPEYRPWRLGALLFSGMGALALIVAVVGIYSTISYDVTQRTREFGVRIALGARAGSVLRLVVGAGVRVVAIGVAAGVLLAIIAGRLVESMLYGIGPRDPLSMIVVVAVLLGVAVLAAAIPAWRATRVDPIRALRSE